MNIKLIYVIWKHTPGGRHRAGFLIDITGTLARARETVIKVIPDIKGQNVRISLKIKWDGKTETYDYFNDCDPIDPVDHSEITIEKRRIW